MFDPDVTLTIIAQAAGSPVAAEVLIDEPPARRSRTIRCPLYRPGISRIWRTRLDARGTVRKLTGPSIRWQRAPSPSRSPGGELDLLDARDVAGDARGRAIVVGTWRRRCAGSAPCSSDGDRVSGFIRAYDP